MPLNWNNFKKSVKTFDDNTLLGWIADINNEWDNIPAVQKNIIKLAGKLIITLVAKRVGRF